MRRNRFISLAALLLTALSAFSQALPEAAPPLPSELPPTITPRPPVRITTPQNQPRVIRPAPRPLPRPANRQLPDGILEWDAISKDYQASPGETTAAFTFAVTNISNEDVVINWVRPSCGCTVADLPPTPWKLSPQQSGTMKLNVDLRGKHGTLSKHVSVDTSHGLKLLATRVHIPQAVAGVDARERNMQLAMADRQIVFRGDCASCHSTPTVGKMGADLFVTACGICHEAPHRATMVPDLKALQIDPTKDYWKHWIVHGKPGTLMPAFAKDQGGPLTPEQIESLAEYLANDYLVRDVSSGEPAPELTSAP